MTDMCASLDGLRGDGGSQPARFSGQLPPLLGRDTDLLTLTAHLCRADSHLSTLTGPGGVGKSRLAAAAADELTRLGPFAVVLVDLHDVDTEDGVLRSIAGAVGDDFGGAVADPVTRGDIAAIIPDRDVLLVLDGCEQVTETAAVIVRDLLSRRNRLRVLITSRRPLTLYGERLFPLQPLPTPQCPLTEDVAHLQEYPSVALFVDRARAVDPSFALTAENAGPVAEICGRMDGLPLAIELTAARLRLFPVGTLVARLREGSYGGVGRNMGAPHRHRSVHALTEASFRLLDEDQRRMLMRVAVCAKDVGLHTVEDLGGLAPHQTESVLEPLVDLNLVSVRHGAGDPRFAVLETVRVFCMDRLRERGELKEARSRHAEHFQALAERAQPHLTGPDQAQWLGELSAAHDNLQQALDFLRDEGWPAEAARTAVAIHRFWLVHGTLEVGNRHLATLPQADGALDAARGAMAAAMGDVLRAAETFHRASTAYRGHGDQDREQAMLAQRHAALQHAGERLHVRSTDYVIRSAGRAEAPIEIGDAALALATASAQDLDRCEELLEAARTVYARHQDVRGFGLVLAEQGEVAVARGQFDLAERLFRLSLEKLRSVGERTMLPTVLDAYAFLLWQQVPGQEDRVVRVMAASSALRKTTNASPLRIRRSMPAGPLRQLRRNLGSPQFEALWHEGRLLDSAATVAEMLSAPTLAGAGGGRTPATQQEAKLTPRQYQIASLVSQGLTNRQIAHQLQISEWTAVNHVRQIMHRLGLPSRIHVAQWVMKLGDGLGHARRGEHGG
ncbi:ATP-binding protein [Actinocrispum wychmicini]|uniref:Non-specific serine/threonine protein kinase n=1 Tax=Actinocrispum wychmicini TaxID=1213861 RepID=A0A4R2JRD4_9PSEU|nr:LuxR C-terminal-related transcriptional regulator [Actinocrispum wychmicini]TCO59778.1 non-specific serine/threonine protein kinase [Actinocrispum wychmicini]